MLQVITTRKGDLNSKTECNARHNKSLRKQTERERERRVKESNCTTH
jgi:hypothetical protein